MICFVLPFFRHECSTCVLFSWDILVTNWCLWLMRAMLWDWLLCVAIAILGIVVIFGGSSSIIVIIFIVIVLVIKLVFWSVGAYGGDETSQLKDEIEALKRRLELQKIEHKQEQHWAVKENMMIIVTKHGKCWHLKSECQHVQTGSSQILKPCKHCTSTLGLVSQGSSISG